MTTYEYNYIFEDEYDPNNKIHKVLVKHMKSEWGKKHDPGVLYNMGRQLADELPDEVKNEIKNSIAAEQERRASIAAEQERLASIAAEQERLASIAELEAELAPIAERKIKRRSKKRKKLGLSPARRVPVSTKRKKLKLGPARRVRVSKRLKGKGFDKKKLKCNTPVKSYKPQKKKMVRACSRGKEKLIHFGATGYGNNYSAGARRAFRARHKCSTAKDKLTARYWACHNLWAGPGGDTRQPPHKRRVKGGKTKKSPVSLKISQLVKEGYPHKQAVAIALSMQESGRITKSGGYRRRKRSPSRRRKRSPSRRRKRSSSRRRKKSSRRRRKRSSSRGRKRSSRRRRKKSSSRRQ